jgi:predicted nucleotidyltransferase component of viral defense system
MDFIFQKPINPHIFDWRFETLPRKTKKALDFLSKEKWLEKSEWYLAGGTALALYAGHRKSVDLDFFTIERNFDEKKLLANFTNNSNWEIVVEEKNTIYGELFKAKVSFIAYPFFIPMQEKFQYGFIKILAPIDIAVMKITAISQRGRKRDFFDLYWCAKNLEPLEKTIRRLKKQYPSVAHNYHHILKSLVYFEDAENDPNPEINFQTSWREVKRYFNKEIVKITKNLIEK